MNLVKAEYEALLVLLHRVEIKGVEEARALLQLEQKLKHKVANWISPDLPVLTEEPKT